MEVADGGERVWLCAGRLAAFCELRWVEEGWTGQVFDVGAVKQPVISGKDGLVRADSEVCCQEGLDCWTNVGMQARGRFKLLPERLEFRCGGEVESGTGFCWASRKCDFTGGVARNEEVEEWDSTDNRDEYGETEGFGASVEAGVTDFRGGLLFTGLEMWSTLLHRSKNEVDEGVVILRSHQQECGDSTDGGPKNFADGDMPGPLPGLWGHECDSGRQQKGA